MFLAIHILLSAGGILLRTEIAQTIDNVKKYDEAKKSKKADQLRASILIIKKMLDERKEKWTLNQLAEVIGNERDERNQRLYKLCVELQFPLAKSTENKRKIGG